MDTPQQTPSLSSQPLCYNARLALFMLSYLVCFPLTVYACILADKPYIALSKQVETLVFFVACILYHFVKKAITKYRLSKPKTRPRLKPVIEFPLIVLSVIAAIFIFVALDPPVKLRPVLLFASCGVLPGNLLCFLFSKLLLRIPWCNARRKKAAS